MNSDIKEKTQKYTMPTYGRNEVNFVSGKGSTLYDDQGKAYTDFLAGIAVCCLGHAHPKVTRAVCEQAGKITHACNLFYTEPQAHAAELLVENSFADMVFFCNSGAEANEGALKLSRLWGKEYLGGAYGVICMENSFHGRTMKALSATGQPKLHKGFEPMVPGFSHVPFGDAEAVANAWDKNTCAVLLEPVQGEGGVVAAPDGYLEALRKICDEHGGLLIYDEIQTGLGRTGKLFAYEHSGVAPDVMTLAKALANGLPAGAILAKEKAAKLFGPGKHGSTFAGGPVVMEAARVVLEHLTADGFMDDVAQKGKMFKERLMAIQKAHPDKVEGVRGMGLMLGLVMKAPAGELVKRLLDKGFVANCTQERVLRFLPPLIITETEIKSLAEELTRIIAGWTPEKEAE